MTMLICLLHITWRAGVLLHHSVNTTVPGLAALVLYACIYTHLYCIIIQKETVDDFYSCDLRMTLNCNSIYIWSAHVVFMKC